MSVGSTEARWARMSKRREGGVRGVTKTVGYEEVHCAKADSTLYTCSPMTDQHRGQEQDSVHLRVCTKQKRESDVGSRFLFVLVLKNEG